MSSLEVALGQLQDSRNYSVGLIDRFSTDDWFRQPAEGVTHLAWQVGHLAFAQYALALRRMRGEQLDDERLISSSFRESFGRGSQPSGDANAYPTITEIRQVFDRVHVQVLKETLLRTDEELATPVSPPHPEFQDKLGSLFWCSRHEMLHAGQIGLLRRLLGSEPMR